MGTLDDDTPPAGEEGASTTDRAPIEALPIDAQPADTPATHMPVAVPLLEIIDRDGQVRQSHAVRAWPLSLGRALDNDVVLSDAHIAAHHLAIEQTASGLQLAVGDTRNDVRLGKRRLATQQRALLATRGEPIEFSIGRTRLRLRLPGQALAAELVLARDESLARQLGIVLVAAFALIAGTLFTTYLSSDPDGLGRAVGGALLAMVIGAAIWCGGWALLSKTFAHQARFGWHLRVFLIAGVALLAVDALPQLLAFMFSWPWISDFAFVAQIAVVAAALYFHLLAVEPARRRLLRAVAALCALVGIGLTLWFNVQRADMFGDELYMSHLFPPGLRVAKPIAADAFVDGLAPLKATLDKKAKESGRGDDDGPRDEEDQ